MKLVIVESPAKAKTISKFLGREYQVEASYGHVRDLPRSARELPKAVRDKPWAALAVDTERGFKPIYIVPPESKKRIRELSQLMSRADEVLLATDEDREGESISWHLLEVLNPKRSVPVRRIAFHEITKPAIEEALANPRQVNRRLVQAQEARRVLDRLFGYSLSPVLWKKVRTKLSAGRVQSVALRLVVDREEERQSFKASAYWHVAVALEGGGQGGGQEFAATLVRVGDARVATSKDFDPTTGERLSASKAIVLDEKAATEIAKAAPDVCPWRVASVERKAARQRPAPPFTTSTLQQAASNRLRFSPSRTMRLAQRLYEGVELGGGEREGLITYMRTDSVTLSAKALADAGRYIRRTFGDDYHKGPRRYRTKAKSAQEAHEAIRPTEIARAPDRIASFLDKDELALYRLIWSRAVASQMADAQIDRTTANLHATLDQVVHVFRSTGSVLRFPGFLKVYGDRRKDQLLPPLQEGDTVLDGRAGPAHDPPDAAALVRSVEPNRRETKPPPRYTEASLVKKLEEEGIGRPSTYTPTISTIQDRDYVRKKNGSLVPTYVGMAVTRLLRSHFGTYVDLRFTARMEDALDDIAAGDAESRRFLDAFYNGEAERPGLVRRIAEVLPEIDFPSVPVGTDRETGAPIRVRIGRNAVYVERGTGRDAARATVPAEMLIDELTPERAVELLAERAQSDRVLGDDPGTGMPVLVRAGPYGPYVQLGHGRKSGKAKPRRVSLPDEVAPADATLEYALKLLALPRTLGKDPESGSDVVAGLGRYGPYVGRNGEYRDLESVDRIFTVELDEALSLLAKKKPARRRTTKAIKVVGVHPDSGAELRLLEGRWGPYVTDGKLNANIPKDRDPMETTVEQALELLAAAAQRKKSRPPRRSSGKRRSSVRRR